MAKGAGQCRARARSPWPPQAPSTPERARHRGRSCLSAVPGRSQIGGTAPEHSGAARIGRNMVSAPGNSIRKEVFTDATPAIFDCAKLLASEFAATAALHDREASFPFENFNQLSEAGILAPARPTAPGCARPRPPPAAPLPKHLRK